MYISLVYNYTATWLSMHRDVKMGVSVLYLSISIALLTRAFQKRSRPQQLNCVGVYTPKRHRQLQVKDLPKIRTWRLERDSNPRPFCRKASTLQMRHHAPHCTNQDM